MPHMRIHTVPAIALTALLMTRPGIAQTAADVEPTLTVECETYCSETKVRTANARLSWTDPGIVAARALGVAPADVQQQIETTVFKQGFAKDAFARFPAVEPTPEGAPRSMEIAGARAGLPIPRPFDLRIIGATRPAVGAGAADIMRFSPEQQKTSIIVEGLEPGLNYWWRVRFRTSQQGWQLSEPVMCVAPVCPADMREEP